MACAGEPPKQAPYMALRGAVQQVAVQVQVAPPCHFMEDDTTCKEAYTDQDCRMDWEKPDKCSAVGFPVCCQVNLFEFWYKAGQTCSDLPGSQPHRPCDASAPSAQQAAVVA